MFLCNVNLGIEIIKYQLKAKGRHGIHSPFVYKMVENVFSKPLESSILSATLEARNRLEKDFRVIKFSDFGAGSKKLSKHRTVRETYRQSATTLKYASVLSRLCTYYKPKNILELGTSLGMGTLHLSWGNPKATIHTVDACEEVQEIAKELISNQLKNNHKIIFHNQLFVDYLNQEKDMKYDLVYLDGHHDGVATLNYVEMLTNKISNECILIIDDIRWSEDMFQAWNELIKSQKFNVSIDIFRMGILIPRKEQRKEHFILKC